LHAAEKNKFIHISKNLSSMTLLLWNGERRRLYIWLFLALRIAVEIFVQLFQGLFGVEAEAGLIGSAG
jgi:hypothetical protein